MAKTPKYLFLLLIIVVVASCSKPTIFDKTKDIEDPWIAQDKISFLVTITDTIQPYNFLIQVRNSVDYEYSNLFVFMKTYFPDGRFALDTINIWLSDQSGKWIGKGFGKYRDTEILYKKNGRFPMSGEYRFEFEQAMRKTELQNIKSIGIRIEHGEIKNQ